MYPRGGRVYALNDRPMDSEDQDQVQDQRPVVTEQEYAAHPLLYFGQDVQIIADDQDVTVGTIHFLPLFKFFSFDTSIHIFEVTFRTRLDLGQLKELRCMRKLDS